MIFFLYLLFPVLVSKLHFNSNIESSLNILEGTVKKVYRNITAQLLQLTPILVYRKDGTLTTFW